MGWQRGARSGRDIGDQVTQCPGRPWSLETRRGCAFTIVFQFWLPKMDADINYTQSCPECQQDKSCRHRKYGLLSSLELLHALWKSIAMDFITHLPESMSYTELWVVIDRFTKLAHFTPLSSGGSLAKDFSEGGSVLVFRLYYIGFALASSLRAFLEFRTLRRC